MITTLITATILARVLAGGPQAPVAHPCSEAGDGWEQLLSEAALPDNGWRRFLESIRTALVAACEVGRSESEPAPQAGSAPQAAQTGPGGAPQVDQTGSGFAAGDVRGDADLSATDDERTAGADGSSLSDLSELSEPPTRVRPPIVVPSAPPRASRPSTPEASRTSPSPASTQRSQRPFDVKPAKRSQRPSDLESAKQSQEPSRLTPAKRSQPLDHGQIAAVAALRQIGRPYVWGGGSSAGPTGGGFDCSGLALHAWSKAGAALTHYTGSQFKQGRRVPFSQLRPGDLVFFGGGTGDPAHVGVYVKDGVMVHAPKRGDVVRTTNFAASPYYRLGYRGAVRPAPR